MKKLFISSIMSFLLTAIAAAGGITGKVQDSKGRPKSGVTITVKIGNQKTSVRSNKDGTYVVEMPSAAYGLRAKVYAGGRYVTKCLIPANGAYSRVNVTYK